MPDELSLKSSVVARPAKGRDARLDFWRGLCLIDMVLVHLVYYDLHFGTHLSNVLTEYTRFAAGGFVFLSGLCIGRIFLPKVLTSYRDQGSAMPIYRRIWARAGKILVVEFVTTLIFFLINVPQGSRATLTHPLTALFDLATFRKGNDLLLLYVGMLAITPLLLELLRLRLWPVIVVTSALFFTLVASGAVKPWQVAFVPNGEFPVLLWQAVFISGLMFTVPLSVFDRASIRLKIAVITVICLAFAVIFQSANTHALGLGKPWLPFLSFIKIPLTFGEFLRYLLTTLLIMLFTNAAWPRLRDTRATALLCLLGRNSLFVYVAHLYLQEAVAKLVYRTRAFGLWQMSFAVVMIALLGCMAYAMEWFTASRKPAPSKLQLADESYGVRSNPSSLALGPT